jgi:exopolyphosphatase/guanosine-5'-triphosphate,3'-diphosphate pyrophosphatase
VTRVAAIDCGTNSIRLLVADVVDGRLTDLAREMRVVRLGQGVDHTGRLAPEAIERTITALRDYASTLRSLGADAVRMVATSASRDAANREDFVHAVVDVLGVEPDVVTGDEDAELSFAGATSGLSADGAPYLDVDIGGGSTEFVLGHTAPAASCSVDVGCVRLTERHLQTDPPTADEIAAAERDIESVLATVEVAVPVSDARTLVGVAGSVTTVAAIALGLSGYDPQRIHHSRLSRAQARGTTDRLLAMSRAERAAVPSMHPGRVDVIGAGALVLATTMDTWGIPEMLVSEHDILDGIALSAAAGAGKAVSA